MNKLLKRIFIAIIILIAIAIVIIIMINKNEQSTANNVISEEDAILKMENEIQIAKQENLANKTESSRIKNYVGQFYTSIETKNYDTTYNMLFDSFKENYFKTETEFEEYVKNKFPKKIVLNYNNMDREGKYYIATVEVVDALNTQNKFTQRVVVEEIELNKFKISFEVI